MTIGYNLNIPDSTHNPSNDQPNMQENTNATSSIWSVDHLTFGANPAGTHKQASFSSNNSISSLPGGILSVLYPAAQGLVSSTPANASSTKLFNLNADGCFPLCLIKACGSFVKGVGPSITNLNGINVASIVSAGGGVYTITLTPGVITGDNILFLGNQSVGTNGITWTFTNPTLTLTGLIGSGTVSFVVMQV